MKTWVLVVAAVGAVALLGVVVWLVWSNRSSEKLVTTSLSLIVVASVGAILSVLVFSEGTKETVEFPVSIIIEKKSGTPTALAPPPFIAPVKNYGFAIAEFQKIASKEQLAALKLGEIDGRQKFYLQALHWEILDVLQNQYSYGWKVKTTSYKVAGGDARRWQTESAGGEKLEYDKVRETLLKENVLTAVDRKTLTGISGLWLTQRVSLESLEWMVGVGMYATLLGIPQLEAQDKFATITYLMRIETTTNRLFQGNPNLPPLKKWASQMTTLLKDSLDSSLEWDRFKEQWQMRQLMQKN